MANMGQHFIAAIIQRQIIINTKVSIKTDKEKSFTKTIKEPQPVYMITHRICIYVFKRTVAQCIYRNCEINICWNNKAPHYPMS